MKEIIVVTYKSSKPAAACGNAKSRRKALRAAKFANAQQDKKLSRSIVKSCFNTTERTAKALTMPTVKSKEPVSTACCLPNISKFAVNAKPVKKITARYEASKVERGEAPVGQQTVIATISSLKRYQFNMYAEVTTKAFLTLENGATASGTLPRSLSEAKVGDMVQITATFERAQNDSTHAYYSNQIK